MKKQLLSDRLNWQENTPRLETTRLILRRFTMDDLLSMYELLRDEAVNKFLPWFPVKSVQEAAAFLKERYLDLYENPVGYHYGICLKEDGDPIGYIQISDAPSHDLGYGLKKEYWNCGIVTEAALAVSERARQAGYPFLTATHDVKNPASGKVMRKIGMTYRYTYEEQWMPKNERVHFRMYQIDFDGGENGTYREYWEKYPVHFIEEF